MKIFIQDLLFDGQIIIWFFIITNILLIFISNRKIFLVSNLTNTLFLIGMILLMTLSERFNEYPTYYAGDPGITAKFFMDLLYLNSNKMISICVYIITNSIVIYKKLVFTKGEEISKKTSE